MARSQRFPIDPEGFKFCLPVLALLVITFALGWAWVSFLLILILLVLLAFFRDPRREIPRQSGAVVSPADGLIDTIYTNSDPEAGPAGGQVIGIFLSVLNVHINRAPCAGLVERIHYVPGKFLDARAEDCSRCNESNWIYFRCGSNRMTVRQIAGLIARRIICRVEEGQHLRKGERIGIIRFGSRTELYLPPAALLQVRKGDRVKGGMTIVALLPATEASVE